LNRARFVPSADIASTPPEADETACVVGTGEVRYAPFKQRVLKAGERVVLFVHGFNSDSAWMIGGPLQFLNEHGAKYDRVLTFDYESFNTPIAENGEKLAVALRQAGFGPDDNVTLDVIAHSMGTLVTRSMVEMHGGDAFVDRCLLAGPPNAGTPLAVARTLVPWLGTVALNSLGTSPPTAILSWLLKKASSEALGPADLHPNSEFLKQLNDASTEVRVPYTILAGRNELSATTQGAWQRLAHKFGEAVDAALDLLFQSDNDLVIGVRSMQTVRNGTYPKELLKLHTVPSDHFDYFENDVARALIREWLGDA